MLQRAHACIQRVGAQCLEEGMHLRILWFERGMHRQHAQPGGGAVGTQVPVGMVFDERLHTLQRDAFGAAGPGQPALAPL
ncbi:hypothetical protein D3C81_1120080 [compost metagenome]